MTRHVPLKILLLLHLLLLQACSSSGDKIHGRIAGLQLEPVNNQVMIKNIHPRVSFNVDQNQVIKEYRELVELGPGDTGSGREIQRLADLELETSLDNRLSENPEVMLQGEQQAQLAIQRYEQYLKTYPDRPDNDRILYQLARAYAIAAQTEQADAYMDRLAAAYPNSRYIDEVQFRRGENLFVRGRFIESEQAYATVVNNHPDSIYFEKSLYKLGWTLFKQNKVEQALHQYIRLLDMKQKQHMLNEFDVSNSLSRAELELLNDLLRVISLSFSYLPARQPISPYFNRFGKRVYEPLVYRRLGELYMRQQRYSDARDIYLSYGENYPFSRYTPVFHERAIQSMQQAGFVSSILPEKERFVKLYNAGTPFWEQQDAESRKKLEERLTEHLFEIATHYHARAGETRQAQDYAQAAGWYKLNLDSFPGQPEAAKINFLLAETYYEAGDYSEAIRAYQQTAYQYPLHEYSGEAGFAAFYAYDRLYRQVPVEQQLQVNQKLLASALQYNDRFNGDARLPDILLKIANNFYTLKDFASAIQVSQLVTSNNTLEKGLRYRAWLLTGHAAYAAKRFDLAEQAYRKSINNRVSSDSQKQTSGEADKNSDDFAPQLALAIYRQGEQARELGHYAEAANHFLRVAKQVPGSPTAIIADYDAATMYLTLNDWPAAIHLLEQFRNNYPSETRWQRGLSEKLALAYNKAGLPVKAADELLKLIELSGPAEQQDLLWQAAGLYSQAGEKVRAIEIYKTSIRQYPDPLSRSIELRHKVARYYAQADDIKRYHFWLNEIVKADATAQDQRSDRSRYLAALASLELSGPVRQKYLQAGLTTPLKKSLALKKKLMKAAIDAYTRAARYQVEEVTTAATFQLAEIYREFASALLKSERPKQLNAEELEEYNYLLEDQAYPFEEKAIQIHESNLSRIPAGSYDESIRNSLQALGKLLPYRYAKNEMTETYAE